MCSKCLNIYCRKCIDKWINTDYNNNCHNNYQNSENNFNINIGSCVSCRNPFIPAGIPKSIINTIDKFIFNCPNNAIKCKEKGSIKNITEHYYYCEYNISDFYCIHCLLVIANVEKDSYGKLITHYNNCSKIKVSCEYCKMQYIKECLESHKETCEFRSMTCPDCKFRIIFNQQAIHKKRECFDNIKNFYNSIFLSQNNEIEFLKTENAKLKAEVMVILYIF